MSEDNKHFVHIQLTDSRKHWKLQNKYSLSPFFSGIIYNTAETVASHLVQWANRVAHLS